MLGVPLFRGQSRARFLRAAGAVIGSGFIFAVSGCATTAGSGSCETSSGDYARCASHTSRPPRDDAAIGLNAVALERRAYVRAVLERNPTIESARQGWRAALSRVQQSGTFEDPMIDLGVAPLSIGSSKAPFGYEV